jgi:hypothetical protein
VPSQRPAEREPVHVVHEDVAHDGVGCLLLRLAERLLRAESSLDDEPRLFELHGDEFAFDPVVVHDEYFSAQPWRDVPGFVRHDL